MASLQRDPIDPASTIALITHPGAGAVVTFAGVVRDEHHGREVIAIDYHAYEPMALAQLERIEAEARERWPEIRIAIVHRIGHLELEEASVFIAVSSPHRPDAYEASRHAIDRIKEIVPIWKKEFYPDGYAWIEGS